MAPTAQPMSGERIPWNVSHFPAANTKATITQGTAGAGRRNVCDSITATFESDATPATVANKKVQLIDGASGATTIKWGTTLGAVATGGATNGVAPPAPRFGWRGSEDTPMTLEFESAGGAGSIQSVQMSGYSEPAL